jgi:predicted RNase H-like nuclease (RuvC/YqgF family)
MKGLWIIAASVCLLATGTSAAEPAAKPTPTPTPHKLSGGFGRGADAVVTPQAAPATPGTGQSLADAVRAASAGRKKEAKGRIAITNQTLVTDPRKGKLTTASPRPPAPTPAAVREEVTPTPAPAEEAEAYWRDRMHTAKARVEELQDRVRRFEQESKKLENDFYSWDDGQYRDGVIKPAWDRKREELETARRDLQQAEKDVADLPEKARKAGALPGWLRE